MTDPTVASADKPVGTPEAAGATVTRSRSLGADAWYDLRRRPLFIVATTLITALIVLSLFPQLFTSVDPTVGDLSRARQGPSTEAWFGYDNLGRDVYARTIYGTRVSIVVGILATTLVVLFGAVMGLIAGFVGGWLDSLLARIADVFFGVPFVLGAIVVLSTFRQSVGQSVVGISGLVIGTIGLLSWPITMRIMRSAAIAARNQDYVKAARALGAGPWRIIVRHMLPNTIAPVMVYATIALGAFIGAEATLSFLGVGLRDPVVSWGVMISEAQSYLRTSPHLLLFPGGFLVVTVLAFVLLGDAVRDAFDPKGRS
ncbi:MULTISPECIES: ABC transporter permease [Pseudonocardia]|uniref:Glutathione transport system permease protein GsiD n=2 Tax=Pseudonocardia TaxID=1847 RepID=A0A1Y2N5D2_PSEAH|nr:MULTISPECIES: ABC transporter permease [Pseudonocardia]OSY42411.1 Glutathione transport system permease protein GsiD [Pseudonocardia autotrophica]TDN75931.1 oligopeptide transport system permease protein [Pseudonocardia autotrophica]BBF99903.1 peptide ABC transporter permease [Pseudonocardia autotrophica]GEC28880.1 peptide ABC transporter permease [Pseudonocardia saturnea]